MIGQTIWRFDINRRVYEKGKSGPIWREHWVPLEVVGETSRSWIAGRGYGECKIPKKGSHGGFAFSQEEIAQAEYVHERYKLSRRVDQCRDYATLKAIEQLLTAVSA